MPTVTADELSSQFNFEALADQMQSAIDANDPMGMLESNINWELDNDLDPDNIPTPPEITSILSSTKGMISNESFRGIHPFRSFRNWFRRSRLVKKIRRALCMVVAEIQRLIDERETLQKIILAAAVAIATTAGIAINPWVLTILASLLVTMILKGVDAVCPA